MPFCDIDTDVKPWLNIDPAVTTHDANLTIMRDSVEQSVLLYTETEFALTAVSEILDGSQADQIVTRNYPITSVQAVYFNVKTDGTEGCLLTTDEYQVLPGAVVLTCSRYTPRGRALIRVDYTYGYDGVPPDVKYAILLSIEAYFRRKGRKSVGINSRSKKDESESFSDSSGAWDSKTGLPTEAVQILKTYRAFEMIVQPIAQRNL